MSGDVAQLLKALYATCFLRFDATSRRNPEGKLEVRKTDAAISPVCLRDRHLTTSNHGSNAPVNVSGS